MTTVRIRLPDGEEADMPLAQALAVAALSKEHHGSTWHFANCRCCVCFHPGGDVSRGWLIGSDGEAEYHEGHGGEA